MSNTENKDLNSLEHQVDQLIYHCNQLEKENKMLRSKENSWDKEKDKLVQKNEMAKVQVDGMLDRLHLLENPQLSSSK